MTTLIDRLKRSIKRLEAKIEAGEDSPGTHRLLNDYKNQLKGSEAFKGQSAKQVFFAGSPRR